MIALLALPILNADAATLKIGTIYRGDDGRLYRIVPKGTPGGKTFKAAFFFRNDPLEAGITGTNDCRNGACRGSTSRRSVPARIPTPSPRPPQRNQEPSTRTVGGHAYNGGWVMPIRSYSRISSEYGMRVHPISGKRKLHKGTDFAAGVGTPVYAAKPGKVIRAVLGCAPGSSKKARRCGGGYGNNSIIQHPDGTQTLYAHLHNRCAARVRPGMTVNQGAQIACVGRTGSVTGAHLHFEVHTRGGLVNPRRSLGL